MAIVALTDPFAPTGYGGTFATATTVTLTSGVAAGGLAVVAYVHNISTVADTFTIADSKSNTYTQLANSSSFLSNNSHVLVAWSKVSVALVTGDTITVTSSVSRARRAIHVRAFTGVESGGAVAAKDQVLNTATPSVALTTPEDGCLVIGVLGHNLSTGALTWSGMTDPDTVTTAAGTSDKTLGTAYKIDATAGAVTTSGTLAVSGPWNIVAVALRPSTTTHVAGQTYQLINDVWS